MTYTLTRVETVKDLPSALQKYFPTPKGHILNPHELSVWAGPALMDTPQPLIIGYGHSETTTPTLYNAAQNWENLKNQVEISPDIKKEFHATTGLNLPLGFFSLGFSPDTPGIMQIPTRCFIQINSVAWLLTDTRRTAKKNLKLDAPTTTYTLRDDSAKNWTESVARVIKHLQNGYADKTVLARDVHISASQTIDLVEILTKLTYNYPSCWQFTVAGLIGATPEMLADIRHDIIRSRVLAGTTTPGNEEHLANSEKDLREHAIAAESVKEALQKHCSELDAPAQPFILRLPNVSHLATDMVGRIATKKEKTQGEPLFNVLLNLHPTAAVCGTPRDKALKLIDTYETTKRGRYAGPVGWIDSSGNGAAALALRCGQLSKNATEMQLIAGCGIMPNSEPKAELAETQAKLRPMKSVFGL